jgi:hypothetical protein
MTINKGDRFYSNINNEWLEILSFDILYKSVDIYKKIIEEIKIIEYSYDYDRGTDVELTSMPEKEFLENIKNGDFIPAKKYRKEKINNILNG